MPSAKKTEMLEDLKQTIQRYSVFIFSDFTGLSVKDITQLRRNIRQTNSEYRVIKNSLFRIGGRHLNIPNLDTVVKGPTAVSFSHDPVAISKTIMAFAKEHENFKVKCGYINERFVPAEDIQKLSRLPSRDELIAQCVRGVRMPLVRLVSAMTFNIQALIRTLGHIKQIKHTEAGTGESTL